MRNPFLMQVTGSDTMSLILALNRRGNRRGHWLCLLFVFSLFSCDSSRLYDENFDFEDRSWMTSVEPEFEFYIDDIDVGYDLFVNVRNETSYPNANLYFTYFLKDSTGRVLEEKLISEFLFDSKSGKPFGKTVLGDIFDHRFSLLQNYRFPQPGKYTVSYAHSMRTDTLRGVLAIGLRVDRHLPN